MTMPHGIALFFGGMFLTNAIPHFVAGCMGHPFQSPFAKPPGKGLSSSTVNILWGFFNFVLAWLLLVRAPSLNIQNVIEASVFGAGILIMGLIHARNFGPLHGGDLK